MASIVPSAELLRRKYALVSTLRAQGIDVDSGAPGADAVHLLAEGETPASPRAA